MAKIASTIDEGSPGDFDIEGEHWLWYTPHFDGAYMDLYVYAWVPGKPETKIQIKSDTWAGYVGDYKSGQHTQFNTGQIALIYSLYGNDAEVGKKINFVYVLNTYEGAGRPYVGDCTSRTVQGTILGTARILKEVEKKDPVTNETIKVLEWKNCIPFVKVQEDRKWYPCAYSVRYNGVYQQCNPYNHKMYDDEI